ncbi:MAG: RDD family protein [Candidatus Obscuribacterales bacterium]|nr:RDD family protein [Candidatus Obscuribacterales bacterium]
MGSLKLMTRSPGGSGRPPSRPYRDDDDEGYLEEEMDEQSYVEPDDNVKLPTRSTRRPPPSRRRGAVQTRFDAEPEKAVSLTEQVDIKVRGIALMLDVMGAFVCSLVVMPIFLLINRIIPFLGGLVSPTLLMILVWLVRDHLFEGHGIGKNLMKLQVVDATTGAPPTWFQSIKRNILFLIPLLVPPILLEVLKHLSLPPDVTNIVVGTVNVVSSLYVVALIPAECWFAFSSGRRIGDKIANTTIIQSGSDFSKLL